MDMTTLILKVTSPAFPIDMIIIYWICFGFSFGLFWDALLLIWPPTAFGLIWLWPKFSYRDDWTLLSKWPRPHIDMRGWKGDFLPSVISQFEHHFSCHWYRKYEGHLLKKRVIFTRDMTVHFGQRKYSQWDSKSAPKNSQSFIISIGQTICKENIIEVNLERIIPPEKDSRRTYYRLEQCFPWIWTVLSTKSIDFNNKSIRGIRCFKNVQTPEFRPFIPLHVLSH